MTEEALDQYEWLENGKGYREWLIPGDLINRHMRAHLVDNDDGERTAMRGDTTEEAARKALLEKRRGTVQQDHPG